MHARRYEQFELGYRRAAPLFWGGYFGISQKSATVASGLRLTQFNTLLYPYVQTR